MRCWLDSFNPEALGDLLMESEMQCPHCRKGLRIEGDQLVCSCGYRRDSPYKTVPSQEELLTKNAKLITENKRLWDEHCAMGDVLNGEGSNAHKLAEIQQIWEAV